MDSYFIPLLFMLSIGMAIVYNLGSNYFLGEISYITKALAAVLQLGVTLDYSIFLMHSYEEQQARYNGDKERAMAHAISQTFSSVIGSSVTTVAAVLGVCVGTLMTLVVQSSSATIAVLQNFAAQPGPDGVTSMLGLAGAIPILLGDNIGTTITALLASIGQTKDAKRTAVAHCIFNISAEGNRWI